MKIITCTGFGNSGSSAATDLLSEFNNVEVVPHDFECTFIHEADGLYDLECAIKEGHRLKVDLAVKRFISLAKKLDKNGYNKYFDGKFLELTQYFINMTIGCRWDGWWHRSNETEPLDLKERICERYLNYKFRKQFKYSLYENDSWMPSYLAPSIEYYESDIDNFLYYSRKYISNLMSCLNRNNKDILVIDQLLPPTNTELYLHYFDDIKVIIVDRDPRDYYFANNIFWASRYIPTENVNTFIRWYSKTRELVFESSQIKRIYLEELVYNYDDIADELIDFCMLDRNSWSFKRTYFVPEKSESNTGLFYKFNGYDDDINYICNQLSNYLYNYQFDFNSVVKRDIIPAMQYIKNYDEEFKKHKISLLGLIISIKMYIKALLKNER